MQPTRKRIEPGILARFNAEGEILGYEIQFKADGRSRRRTVQGGLREARDELAAARTRRSKQEREPSNPRVRLDAVIDHFEAAHVAGLRVNSQDNYRTAFKRIRPALGRKRISQITRADVKAFVAAEMRAGYKANTVRMTYGALRATFNFASRDLDVACVFPALRPKEFPNPADDAREHRVLSDDELQRVLAACPPRIALCVRTLAETGARASEVLGLTPQRVGDGSLTFAQQLARDGSLRPPKTPHSRRTIEIRPALAAELRLHGDRSRTFPLLSCRAAARLWATALERAALDDPQPTLHDMRHSHVSRLIALGLDPQEIASRIGDTLQTTLRVYGHEFDSQRRGEQRRAVLEDLYGDGAQMATHTRSQVVTGGAKVQQLRAADHT
jgi:integrase